MNSIISMGSSGWIRDLGFNFGLIIELSSEADVICWKYFLKKKNFYQINKKKYHAYSTKIKINDIVQKYDVI